MKSTGSLIPQLLLDRGDPRRRVRGVEVGDVANRPGEDVAAGREQLQKVDLVLRQRLEDVFVGRVQVGGGYLPRVAVDLRRHQRVDRERAQQLEDLQRERSISTGGPAGGGGPWRPWRWRRRGRWGRWRLWLFLPRAARPPHTRGRLRAIELFLVDEGRSLLVEGGRGLPEGGRALALFVARICCGGGARRAGDRPYGRQRGLAGEDKVNGRR